MCMTNRHKIFNFLIFLSSSPINLLAGPCTKNGNRPPYTGGSQRGGGQPRSPERERASEQASRKPALVCVFHSLCVCDKTCAHMYGRVCVCGCARTDTHSCVSPTPSSGQWRYLWRCWWCYLSVCRMFDKCACV